MLSLVVLLLFKEYVIVIHKILNTKEIRSNYLKINMPKKILGKYYVIFMNIFLVFRFLQFYAILKIIEEKLKTLLTTFLATKGK